MLIGWGAILAGLAILAGVIAWADRRRPSSPRYRDDAGTGSTTLDLRREWELVMDSAGEGLSRGADLAALQADTALKIEAAEHAFNRLVADFAKLCGKPEAPVVEPAPQPTPQPNEAPSEPEKDAEQPLAA